jgi:hypothetical protein
LGPQPRSESRAAVCPDRTEPDSGWQDIDPLPFDYREEVVGARTPCLLGQDKLRTLEVGQSPVGGWNTFLKAAWHRVPEGGLTSGSLRRPDTGFLKAA